MEGAQRILVALLLLVVVPQLEQHQLADRVDQIRRVEGAALGFAPRAALLQVRFLAEVADALLHRHVFGVEPYAHDEAAEADERLGELAEPHRGVAAAESLVHHHLFAVMSPPLDQGGRGEQDRLAQLRIELAQMLVVQEVPREHLVDRDRPQRAVVEVAQVLLLALGRPRGIDVRQVVVCRRRLRLGPKLRQGAHALAEVVEPLGRLTERRVRELHPPAVMREQALITEGERIDPTGDELRHLGRVLRGLRHLHAVHQQVLAEAQGFNRLANTVDELGHYQGLVGATRRGWAEQHERELIGYIRGYLSGLGWLFEPANKSEAILLLRSKLPAMSDDLASKSYDILLDPQTGFSRKAEVSLEGVRAVLSLRSKYGNPRKCLNDPSKYLDLRFYEMARAVG